MSTPSDLIGRAARQGILERPVERPAVAQPRPGVSVRLALERGHQPPVGDRERRVLGDARDAGPQLEGERRGLGPEEMHGPDVLAVGQRDTGDGAVVGRVDRAVDAQRGARVVGHVDGAADDPGAGRERMQREDRRPDVPERRLGHGAVLRPVEDVGDRGVGRGQQGDGLEVRPRDLLVARGERRHLGEPVEDVRLDRVLLEPAAEAPDEQERDRQDEDLEGHAEPRRQGAGCDSGRPTGDAGRHRPRPA